MPPELRPHEDDALPIVLVAESVDSLVFNPQPVIALGGGKDEMRGHVFFRVKAATLLSQGGFIVANGGTNSLLYYDQAGNFVREVGGSGDGPGEFRVLDSVHRLRSDTIAAWDAGPQRITIIDPSSVAVETFTLSADVQSRRVFTTRYLYEIGDSLFVGVTADLGREPHLRPLGFSRDSHAIAVFDRFGQQIARLGTVAGIEWFRDKETLVAPFSYLYFAASLADAFYVGNGRGPHLVEYTATGDATRRLRLPIERRAMSSREWKTVRDRWVGRFPPGDRARVQATADKALAADSFPAFTHIIAASDGSSLWVELYDQPAAPRRWLAVNPRDATAKSIMLPAGATILDATHDRVLVLLTDEFDREEVRMHTITAQRGAR